MRRRVTDRGSVALDRYFVEECRWCVAVSSFDMAVFDVAVWTDSSPLYGADNADKHTICCGGMETMTWRDCALR